MIYLSELLERTKLIIDKTENNSFKSIVEIDDNIEFLTNTQLRKLYKDLKFENDLKTSNIKNIIISNIKKVRELKEKLLNLREMI